MTFKPPQTDNVIYCNVLTSGLCPSRAIIWCLDMIQAKCILGLLDLAESNRIMTIRGLLGLAEGNRIITILGLLGLAEGNRIITILGLCYLIDIIVTWCVILSNGWYDSN